MLFRFIADSDDGNTVCGDVSATTATEAAETLKMSGLTAKFLQEHQTLKRRHVRKFFGSRGLATEEKYVFFEQLSTLMTAGLTIEQSLKIFSERFFKNKELTHVIATLRLKIASGMSLSEAMACCKGMFSETEIKAVLAAEHIGRPAIALQKLAEAGEKRTSLKKKIKSSLIYPLIVFVVSIVALTILMTVVVPKFEAIFEEQSAGTELPFITRCVISACHPSFSKIAGIFSIAIVIFFSAKYVHRNSNARKYVSNFFSKIPVFGKILILVNLNNFFRVIGMLMSFGTNLQEAFCMATDVIGDKKIKKSFKQMFNRLSHGERLSDVINGNSYVSATDIGLVVAGERSGTLSTSFNKISDAYEQRIENTLTVLATMVEPAIIIILAVFIGTIAVALFLPMLSIVSTLRA